MAIAFDAQSETNVAAGTGTASHAHTCTGANGIIYIGVTNQNSSTITSVKYGGVAATFVGTGDNGDGNVNHLYRLVGPLTGSNTVEVIRSATTGGMWVKVASYTGVAQSSPSDDIDTGTTTGTVTGLTITTTPTQANDWAIFLASNWDGGTVTAGTNLVNARNTANIWNRLLDTGNIASAGAIALTATKGSGASGFTGVVESFKEAPPPPSFRDTRFNKNLRPRIFAPGHAR